jgi:hypothetical protein
MICTTEWCSRDDLGADVGPPEVGNKVSMAPFHPVLVRLVCAEEIQVPDGRACVRAGVHKLPDSVLRPGRISPSYSPGGSSCFYGCDGE